MEKINCPVCTALSVKNGFQATHQRYYCKHCNKKFQMNYTYTAYCKSINHSIVTLIKEGCGIRSISRILKISSQTVLSRLLSISTTLKPKHDFAKGCSYEMD